MSGCLDNLQIPNIDVGEKRNKYASIISGVLVSIFYPTTRSQIAFPTRINYLNHILIFLFISSSLDGGSLLMLQQFIRKRRN